MKYKPIPRTLIHSSSPFRTSHSLLFFHSRLSFTQRSHPPPFSFLLPFSPLTLHCIQRSSPSSIHFSSLILVISSNILKVVHRPPAPALPLHTLSNPPPCNTHRCKMCQPSKLPQHAKRLLLSSVRTNKQLPPPSCANPSPLHVGNTFRTPPTPFAHRQHLHHTLSLRTWVQNVSIFRI